MADIRISKRGKVYQYQFEIASRGGKRKYINKSGFKTRADAHKEGVIAYNEYYKIGKKIQVHDMSYSDFLDYWIDTYCNLNCKLASTEFVLPSCQIQFVGYTQARRYRR